MIDDRLLRAFGTLGAPAEPDAAFADRLFEALASELGFRRAVRPAGSPGERILRALGIERVPSGAPALRLAYLLAVLGLLVALAAAAMLVASQLDQRPSPLELVRLSQDAYDDAPAVRMTIHAPFMDAVLTSDGNGTWRSEVTGEWGDAPGTFWLFDGTRVGWYEPNTRVWSVVPVEDGGPPYPFNDAFTWTQVDFPALVATLSDVPCGDATQLGEATIAGRAADGIACPGVGMQYWVDRESHLVLRSSADQQSPYWAGTPNQDWVVEVTAFEVLEAPSPADFDWDGPPGANSPDSPMASTVLRIGERPPAWIGRTRDNQAVSSEELVTPAAILFFDPSCPRCPEAFDDFAAVSPGIEGLTPIAVGYEDPSGSELVDGFVRLHPTDIAIVLDQGSINQGWGITGRPAIVLLGADGAVSGMFRTRIARDDLGRILAAVAGGEPIPSVAPAPSPTPTPGDPSLDPSVECTEDLVTCLPIGSRMPEWSGRLLAGGTLTTADLAGKPTVIWFQGAVCDGPCPDWFLGEFQAFAALAERDRDRLSYVMVASGAEVSASVGQMLEDAGVDFPVVLDEDGSITDRLHMLVLGTVVFDPDGRLVDRATSIEDIGPTVERLLASPAPSASP